MTLNFKLACLDLDIFLSFSFRKTTSHRVAIECLDNRKFIDINLNVFFLLPYLWVLKDHAQ